MGERVVCVRASERASGVPVQSPRGLDMAPERSGQNQRGKRATCIHKRTRTEGEGTAGRASERSVRGTQLVCGVEVWCGEAARGRVSLLEAEHRKKEGRKRKRKDKEGEKERKDRRRKERAGAEQGMGKRSSNGCDMLTNHAALSAATLSHAQMQSPISDKTPTDAQMRYIPPNVFHSPATILLKSI